MAGDVSASAAVREAPAPISRRTEPLSKWVGVSLVFHLAMIAALFVAPMLPSQRAPEYPIYSVDLVGGEKLGGTNLGTELSAPAAKPAAKKAEPVPAAPPQEKKVEAKKEKKEVPEKTPPKDKAPPPEDALALKQPTKKEPPKKAESAVEQPPQENALERVRERLIQTAAERAKSRTESTPAGPPSKTESTTSAAKGQVISSGPGEGEGAAALGQGGRGGGVVKGIEFIAYRNRVLTTIRENWSWVPQRTDLKVTVHFGIKETGEIVGLKIIQPSGDRTYDESVLRALRKSTPLPPPPENHRSEFMDYTITFTPKDLGA